MIDLTIVTTWYQSHDATRSRELEAAVQRTYESGYVVKILTQGAAPPVPINHESRRSVAYQPTRPTFADAVRAVEPGGLICILNTDCYLEKPIPQLTGLLDGTLAVVLSRHEAHLTPPSRMWSSDSQDAWIFRVPTDPARLKTLLDGCNYFFGIRGCDNAFAYALKQSGFTVRNYGDGIKVMHVHKSDIRDYGPVAVPPPYLFVPVEPLDERGPT
jgi:hypothetical protein